MGGDMASAEGDVSDEADGDALDWQRLFYGEPEQTRPPPTNGHSFGPVNPGSYAEVALDKEVRQVADSPQGERNHTLNVAAFNLGQLVGAGLLGRERVEEGLRWAGLSAGLDAGEVEATLRSGLKAGVAMPRQVKTLDIHSSVAEVAASDLLPPGLDEPLLDENGERVRTSWYGPTIREGAAQALGAPHPTHLRRLDGQPLFYSAKVNGLIGESESGKSWVALLAGVQAVLDGEQMLILDFEDSPRTVQERLVAMGLTDDLLDLVYYARPDEALGAAAQGDLAETLTQHFSVIIVDGINSAMDLMGYDLNSNNDATSFSRRLLRPLAATGACVITVDHVPKNPEQRGKGGIGAQAKRAMIDGCCLRVEVVEPFGKGQSGKLRLEIDKDRNGQVRGISAGGENPGSITFVSIMETVSLEIEPPIGGQEGFVGRGPTNLMESVSKLLEVDSPLSGRAIREVITGRTENVLEAINALTDGGYLHREQGAHRAWVYSILKPYRTDGSTPAVPFPGGSDHFPEPGRASGPRSPLSVGGGPLSGSTGTGRSDEQSGTGGPERCRRCGDDVEAATWDAHDGFCHHCFRMENP
jgi:hypothetical protein